MAITTAQRNAALFDIMGLLFTNDESALDVFLRACVAYHRGGTANEKEAAVTLSKLAYERVVGRTPTVADLHMLTNHLAESGVLT